MKLLSVDEGVIYNFYSLWYIGRSYWGGDGCSAIIFVNHVKTVSVRPSLEFVQFDELSDIYRCLLQNFDKPKN